MRKRWYTDLILLGVFTSWSLAFVLIKGSLDPGTGKFDPLSFVWLRMLLSAGVLFALIPVLGESIRVPWTHLKGTIAVGVVGLGTYHVLFTYALSLTTPVDTALIIATGPVMTAIWMPAFKMERTTRRGWFGVGICFATVAAVSLYGAFYDVRPGVAQRGWDTNRLLGDLIMLVASNCWALNGILCRRVLPHVSAVTITAWGMVWATIVLAPVCAYGMIAQDWSAITPAGWWGFVWAVLPASTISIVFFYFGVKNVGPLHTIVYQNVSPFITAALVYLMLGTTPNLAQIVGVFAIFAGVYLTRTSGQTARRGESSADAAD